MGGSSGEALGKLWGSFGEALGKRGHDEGDAGRLGARGLEGLGLTAGAGGWAQEDGCAQAGIGVAGEGPPGGGRRRGSSTA